MVRDIMQHYAMQHLSCHLTPFWSSDEEGIPRAGSTRMIQAYLRWSLALPYVLLTPPSLHCIFSGGGDDYAIKQWCCINLYGLGLRYIVGHMFPNYISTTYSAVKMKRSPKCYSIKRHQFCIQICITWTIGPVILSIECNKNFHPFGISYRWNYYDS